MHSIKDTFLRKNLHVSSAHVKKTNKKNNNVIYIQSAWAWEEESNAAQEESVMYLSKSFSSPSAGLLYYCSFLYYI